MLRKNCYTCIRKKAPFEGKEKLQTWAKDIDVYSYFPIQNDIDYQEFDEWVNSGNFIIQLIDCDFGIVEKSRLIETRYLQLIGYENLEISDEKENKTMYSFDAKLEIKYSPYEGASIEECIDVHVEAKFHVDDVFRITDVYRINDFKYESEE